MGEQKIVLMGEPMLELSHSANSQTRLSFGGDVLNTAVYLARMGLHPYFVSSIGTDPYSDNMIKAWDRECVQTEYVLRNPEKLPGIYAIQTDYQGERKFYYWRDDSAARHFFDHQDCGAALNRMREASWLYLSGITLSIFSEENRKQLDSVAADVVKRGGKVVFDPNFRAKGWPNLETACAAMDRFGRNVSIILATIDDENEMRGQMTGEQHAARWHALGVETVVLKCGPRGSIIYEQGQSAQNVPVVICEHPTDTTGAGDSFNAAFLSMKCRGHSSFEAAKMGNDLARTVIQHQGAIIPRTSMPVSLRVD